MNIQKEILKVTSEYFKDSIDFLNLSNASKEYKNILNNLCEEDMDIQIGRKDIDSENGISLGTFWAALCLDDLIRTRNFIRGIDKAIKDKLQTKKNIHILYAGTGPFATLILPLILKYSKENIKYTFLEINPFSFKLVQNVISNLDLEKQNISFVMADATKYKLDTNSKPDIIISETMQNALAKEQQVPIFLNLMSQVNSNTIFIPEKIEIYIGFKEANISMEEMELKHIHKEEKVLEISTESIFKDNEIRKNDYNFSKKITTIDSEKLKKYNQIGIFTEIQVYKNERINISQSGLTTPMFINDIPDNFDGTLEISTQYKISSDPKLDYEVTFKNLQEVNC